MEECYTKRELIEKIVANSVWPVYEPNVFYFYKPGEAEKVTEEGKKAIRKIRKMIKDIDKY
jgi:DNA polymerase elongation subunit (family B)